MKLPTFKTLDDARINHEARRARFMQLVKRSGATLPVSGRLLHLLHEYGVPSEPAPAQTNVN